MNTSYAEAHKNAEREWAASRASSIEELLILSPIPPPFSAPFLLYDIFSRGCRDSTSSSAATSAAPPAPQQSGSHGGGGAADGALGSVSKKRRNVKLLHEYLEERWRSESQSVESRVQNLRDEVDRLTSMVESASHDSAESRAVLDKLTSESIRTLRELHEGLEKAGLVSRRAQPAEADSIMLAVPHGRARPAAASPAVTPQPAATSCNGGAQAADEPLESAAAPVGERPAPRQAGDAPPTGSVSLDSRLPAAHLPGRATGPPSGSTAPCARSDQRAAVPVASRSPREAAHLDMMAQAHDTADREAALGAALRERMAAIHAAAGSGCEPSGAPPRCGSTPASAHGSAAALPTAASCAHAAEGSAARSSAAARRLADQRANDKIEATRARIAQAAANGQRLASGVGATRLRTAAVAATAATFCGTPALAEGALPAPAEAVGASQQPRPTAERARPDCTPEHAAERSAERAFGSNY